MLKVVIGYPTKEDENSSSVRTSGAPAPVQPVVRPKRSFTRKSLRDVYMDEKIERYIVDIVFASRTPEDYKLGKLKQLISYGGSPRASINLALASKAYAFVKRRGYVDSRKTYARSATT